MSDDRKLLMCITGDMGANTAEIAQYISLAYGAHRIRLVDTLRMFVEKAGKPVTEQSMIETWQQLRANYKEESILARMTCSRLSEEVKNHDDRIYIMEGIHTIRDVGEVLSFIENESLSSLLLFIDTPLMERYRHYVTLREQEGAKPITELEFARESRKQHFQHTKKVRDACMFEIRRCRNTSNETVESHIDSLMMSHHEFKSPR